MPAEVFVPPPLSVIAAPFAIARFLGAFSKKKKKSVPLTQAEFEQALKGGMFFEAENDLLRAIDGLEHTELLEQFEKCLSVQARARFTAFDLRDEIEVERGRITFQGAFDRFEEPLLALIGCWRHVTGKEREDAQQDVFDTSTALADMPLVDRTFFRDLMAGKIDPKKVPDPGFLLNSPPLDELPHKGKWLPSHFPSGAVPDIPAPITPAPAPPTPSLIPKIEIPLPGTGALKVDITPALLTLPQIITDLVTGSRSDTSRVVSSITSLATQLLTGQRQANNLLASVLLEIAGKFLGPLIPEGRAARQALQLLTAIALEQIGPDLSRIARVSLPQVVSVLGGLNQTLGLGTQGIITTLRQTAQSAGLSQALSAGMQGTALESFLPTIKEWVDLAEGREPAASDGKLGNFKDIFASIFSPFRGEGFPPAPVTEALFEEKRPERKVITIDEMSQYVEGKNQPGVIFVMGFAALALGVLTKLFLDQDTDVPDKMKDLFEKAKAQIPKVRKLTEGWSKKILGFVEDDIKEIGLADPSSGFDNAGIFFQRAFVAGVGAHAVASILEVLTPFKHIGFNQIAGALSILGGFAPILNAVWGRAIGSAVAIPAGYQINSIMRPTILAEGEIDRAHSRRFFKTPEYRDWLSYYGVSEEDKDTKVKLSFRPPSLRDIVRLMRTTALPEADIKAFLMEGGYPDKIIDQMIPALVQASESTERTTLLFEVRNNIANGTISPFEADLVFDRLDMRPGQKEIVLKTAALQKKRQALTAHAGVLESNFQSDVIDVFDLQSGLLNLGFQPDMVDIRISRAQERRLGKTLQKATRGIEAAQRKAESLVVAALKEQFKLGLIEQATYLLLLQVTGVDPFVAAGIVALESIKLTGREVRTEQSQVARLEQQQIRLRQGIFLEQFRKEQITEEQLVINLMSLNLDPQIIEDQVVREKLGKIPTKKRTIDPPKQVKARELKERARALMLIKFRRGEIDADALQSGLIELGGDPDLVRADVEIEVAKRFRELQPPGTPKVDPQIAASKRRQIVDLQRAFSGKVLTVDTFTDQLSRLVSSSDLIEALVEEGFLERALKEAKVAGSA